MDTGINTIVDDTLYGISTDEMKLINRIQKLKNDHPDEVTIVIEPQNNGGCIVARFPKEWLKIKPPNKSNLTEAQRLAVGKRLHSNKKNEK